MKFNLFIFLHIMFVLILTCYSWFPGIQLKSEYKFGDPLNITVGQLYSFETQFPFEYLVIPVCQKKNYTQFTFHIGEILNNDFTYSTQYEVNLGKDEYCKVLCSVKIHNEYEQHIFQWMIDRNYKTFWYLDTLSAGLNYTYKNGEFNDSIIYDDGIPIGESLENDKDYIIYNHYTFLIFTNKNSKDISKFSIVHFNIIPWSIKHDIIGDDEIIPKCAKNKIEYYNRVNWQKGNQARAQVEGHLVYTYDVIFYETSTQWTFRWDHNMYSKRDENILFLPFVKFTVVILIFFSLFAKILSRRIKRDIEYINIGEISENCLKEINLKKVCNDVFRKPKFSLVFCVLIGTGVQLLAMFLVILIGSTLFFLSPENRPLLLSLILVILISFSSLAGYCSTRFYKLFKYSDWIKIALLTTFFLPSIVFSGLFVINYVLLSENTSSTVPFSTMFTLLLIWLCSTAPLILIGAFLGTKKKVIKDPRIMNSLPSSIPPQPWYLASTFICLVSGLINFCIVYTELVYIINSTWKQNFYSLFLFLLVILIIMLMISALISMIVVYFQLTKGDYRWWWKSFFISGSISLYIFLLLAYRTRMLLYTKKLHLMKSINSGINFWYSFLFSFSIFLISGSFGFVCTYIFLKNVYSMIKIK